MTGGMSRMTQTTITSPLPITHSLSVHNGRVLNKESKPKKDLISLEMAEMEVVATTTAATKPPPQWTAHDLLEDTCTAMEEIAAKMLFIKKEARPKSDLKELITNMSLNFIALRQVNRTILLEEDRVKAETESAKAPVDFTTLQLHNLMYEKNHYMKAIKACKDFKSKYPDIGLVPVEEFFASASEDIKGNALATDPAHDLMLKRSLSSCFSVKNSANFVRNWSNTKEVFWKP